MIRPDLMTLFGREPFTEGDTPADFAAPARIAGGDAAPELCQLADRWSVALHPSDAIGQVKMDGHRALYIGGQLVTREGVPMQQAAHSLRALDELEGTYGQPMFFDGEYVHPDGLQACGKPGGTIWLFDAVPLVAWQRNGATASLRARLNLLLERGRHCFGPALGALMPIPLPTPEAAIRKAEELWRLGYEGLVVKAPSMGYDRRRSTRWLKLKQWRTERFRIVDVVVSAQKLDMLLVSVEGRSQRLNVRYLDVMTRRTLARTVKAGDIALIEHCGLTHKGALRDATFQGVDHG
jgi:hypothetical protein